MKKPLRRQSGSILLAMMLVTIVAASFTLISKLNESSRVFIRRQPTVDALRQAKAALIAYALTYPERSSDPAAGPGILPCPDTSNNGQAPGNCSLAHGTTIGRLPWKTLNSGFLTDDSGEALWYAVADKYRTPPPGPVNSDTPGGLSVDNTGDIVAVIIAPGKPLTQPVQNRTAANVNNISDYLEGENANGDTEFTMSSGGNDIITYITRQELMRAVEKRVSGDIITALKSYHTDTGVFPWLTPFDPTLATKDYNAVVNTREGNLAFNDINEVFPTQFYISWDFRSGGNGSSYYLAHTSTMSSWNSFDPIKVNMASEFYTLDGDKGPACRWIARDAIDCVGRAKDPQSVPLQVSLWGYSIYSSSGTRYYDFNVVIPAGATASVCDYRSCTNSVRNRDVSLAADPTKYPTTGFPPGTKAQITVTDAGTINNCLYVSGNCYPLTAPITINSKGQVTSTACVNFGSYYGIYCTTPYVIKGGSNTNTITTATDADINVYDSVFDLGVGDELPQWLTANDWHKYAYVAYSAADVPGAAVSPCVPGGTPACLTLQNTGSVTDNKQAVVIMAGPALAGQNRASAPSLISNYFENTNNDADDVFIKAPATSTFNDLARVILP